MKLDLKGFLGSQNKEIFVFEFDADNHVKMQYTESLPMYRNSKSLDELLIAFDNPNISLGLIEDYLTKLTLGQLASILNSDEEITVLYQSTSIDHLIGRQMLSVFNPETMMKFTDFSSLAYYIDTKVYDRFATKSYFK